MSRTDISALRLLLIRVAKLIWTQASTFVRTRTLLAAGLLVLSAVLTALGPLALKHVVDSFAGQNTGPGVSVPLLIGLYIASQWLARSFLEIRGLVYARAERRMFRTLSEQLFAHVMRLPLRFHLERQTGAINQTLENGLQGFQMIVHHVVFTFLPVIAEVGTIIIVLGNLEQPEFFVLFGLALVCYAVAFVIAASRVTRSASSASTAHINASATMTDSVLNYETVKYFAAESVVQERVRRALVRTENEWVSFYRTYAVNGLAVATIYTAVLAATVIYAAFQVNSGLLTVGGFVLINTYMLQVVRPVEMIGYAVQDVSRGMAMLEKMLDLIGEKAEPAVPDDPSQAPLHGPGRLEFRDVTLAYGPDRAALRSASFVVPAGKTLGIVGASGAGKSTIVRLLVRMFEPDQGRVLIDSVPISELPLPTLRRAVAVVPQDTVLFNDTIAFNIAFGRNGSSQLEVERAAKLAHLHDFIMRLPHRYDTLVGERGVKLSGGEKQRIAIARAAMKLPLIYVFDEATSSLDSRTEREIIENLVELSRSSTAVIIAHRLSSVVHADEIVVLDHGLIVERGTHASLLAHRGRYAALWEAQHRPNAAHDLAAS